MNKHTHTDASAFKENPEKFVEFIRKVSPDADPESVFLFGRLVRAGHQIRQAVETHLSTEGLTWAKFRLLLDLMRHENVQGEGQGMQPSDLSDRQGLSRNTISALIASMEQDGWVSRDLHGTDRRKFVIRLTERGRTILNAELEKEFKFLSDRFAMFSPEERQTLTNLLARLNENLEK